LVAGLPKIGVEQEELMQANGHSLLVAFDTSASDFVRGVEVGRLWEQLRSDEPVEQEVHASNAEMLLRMAEATQRPLKADVLDDTWLLARFDAPAWAAGHPQADDPYCGGF
jgi:hypothetical protein